MPTTNEKPQISKQDSWKIFDEIAPRYDLLNRILSLGLDIRWREKIAEFLPEKSNLRILDIATGTADVLLGLHKKCPWIQSSRGIDLSKQMLNIGRQKIKKRGLESKISLETGDANRIPFSDNSFDVVTVAFGIRNMMDVTQVLREIKRVLCPHGRVLILEFSLPQNSVIRTGHILYLRYIVPFLGYLFSGNYAAYRYLNQTIETFPYGKEFCKLIEASGFRTAQANPLLWGVASIYQGDKP